MPIIDTPPRIDSKFVKTRLTDWNSRLNNLYSRLDSWVKRLPNVTASHGETKQLIEPLMKQFHVAAQRIPTYTVIVDHTWRIAFIPSVLWIVGANGRIDICTPIRQHILVDSGGKNGAPSDWQLAVEDARKLLIPFDKVAFRKLLEERR